LLKFTVNNPNSDFIIRRYEKIEKTEEITSYGPVATAGWLTSALGVLYILSNPAPDPAKSTESKFNSLNDDAGSKRKLGWGAMLIGLGGGVLGMSTSPSKTVVEKPVGVFEEKIPKRAEMAKTQFNAEVDYDKISTVSDTTDNKGEGVIKVNQILARYLARFTEVPEKVTIRITLTENKEIATALTPHYDSAGLTFRREEAIALAHWSPPPASKPFLNIYIFQPDPDKENIETTEDTITLAGLAVDKKEIKDVKILVDGKPVQEGRGIAIVPKEIKQPSQSEASRRDKSTEKRFEYNVSLNMGKNEIKVVATNEDGLTVSKVLTIQRIEEKGETYVLVIGIDKYEDTNIRELPYAEVDAQSVYDFYAGSPKSPAKLGNVSLLMGKQATKKVITKSLGELMRKAKEPDTVICYYAGHGDVGKHPKKGAEYYMIPQDAEKDDLFTSAIELSELQRLWGAIVAKRKVFIADCCNSGGFAELRGEGQEGFEQGLGEGTVVMTASGKGQKALEVPELKHGLFTYFFLKGLEGEANKDNNHKVSVSEMKKFVEENVRNKARELGGAQNPVTKQETTGEIYLTK